MRSASDAGGGSARAVRWRIALKPKLAMHT